jgi:DNA-binding NtrC family response regulator
MAKILLVDDEKSLRVTLSAFLRQAGHVVQTGENIEEAKALIDTNQYACIFSDILMEDGSGIEVLRYAKKIIPATQVIMITGYPNLDTATDALRLGAFDYITKPVLKDSLLKVTKAALNFHDMSNNNQILIKEANEARKNLNSKLREQKTEIESLNKSLHQQFSSSEKTAILDSSLTQVNLPEECLNLDQLTENVVKKALDMCEGNKLKTARYLCVSRDVLRSKLKHITFEE